MNIRESIDYNKDLVSEEESFLVKQKPIFPVSGMVSIELFDAISGEKTYEAKTENIINNIVSKYAYMDYFYNKIKGDKVANYYTAPFQYMVLTDYAGVEDADIPYYKGSLISYSDKATAYSGSDTLKGTVNLAETKLDATGDGLLHFVFDFPTHAANGTFQSIWWSGALSVTMVEQNTFTITAPCTRTDASGSSTSSGSPFALLRTKDYWVLYCAAATESSGTYPSIAYPKYALVYNDNWEFVKKIDVDSKLPSGFNTFCGYGATDDSIVVVNGYNSSNNVCIINIDTLVATTLSLNTETQYVSIYARGSRWFILTGNLKEYVLNGSNFTLVKDYGSNTVNHMHLQIIFQGLMLLEIVVTS